MQEVKDLVIEANKAFETADHLAFVTYPVINDTKLFALVAEQLHRALISGMNALLEYDEMYKRIPPLPDEFENRFEIFKDHVAKRYGIEREIILLIRDINDIVKKRKISPMEFSRRGNYVIATESYKLRILNLEKIKNFVSLTKLFINKINEVYRRSDRRII